MDKQDELLRKVQELEVKLVAQKAEELRLGWWRILDERQRGLVDNCLTYASHEPAGLPGHNLMLVIAKMAALLNRLDPPEEKKLC